MVAEEMIRLKREHGPAAVMTTCSSHHLWGNVGYRFSAYNRFMNLVGHDLCGAQPRQLGRLAVGRRPHVGVQHPAGHPRAVRPAGGRAQEHCEMMVFWSSDPETTGGVYGAHESTCRRQWLKELGVKMVFIDPYFNHTAGLVADKWFAPRMGTDVALGLGIAFVWLTEGLYDKEYVADPHPWLRRMEGLRVGRERRRAQDARVGGGRDRHPGPRDPGPGAGVGRQEDHAGRGRHGRLGRSLPLRPTATSTPAP